ncbi:hypothetical protein COP2_040185 [Malus domestica]
MKEFAQNSERIKSVDLHPTEPWVLVSLYSGAVCIWNYQSQTMEKSFKVTESPVRSAKFVAREHWRQLMTHLFASTTMTRRKRSKSLKHIQIISGV